MDLTRTNELLQQLIDEVRALHVFYAGMHTQPGGFGDQRQRVIDAVDRHVTETKLLREHRDSQSAA